MITTVIGFAKQRASTVFLAIAALFMIVTVFALVMVLTPDDTGEQSVSGLKHELREDEKTAQNDLDSTHTKLLGELGGIDPNRVERDREEARDIVLALADTPASSREVKDEQLSLDARFSFWDEKSRTLTEFLPEWMATGDGRHYALTDLDVNVTGIQSLTYEYTAVARLDPAGGEGGPHFLLLTMTTTSDGKVTVAEVNRASNSSRNNLAADPHEDSDG